MMLSRYCRKTIFTLLRGGLLYALLTLSVFAKTTADNPCGVSCTETIASQVANSAATTIATNIVNNAINTRVYEKITIYAENAANITGSGGTQWSYGDGDIGVNGIALPETWELYAVSLQADSVTADADVVMNVINANSGTSIYQFTAPLLTPVPPTTNGVYTEILTTPITVPAGTTIGFTTVSVSAGAVSSARVSAWLRRRPD